MCYPEFDTYHPIAFGYIKRTIEVHEDCRAEIEMPRGPSGAHLDTDGRIRHCFQVGA